MQKQNKGVHIWEKTLFDVNLYINQYVITYIQRYLKSGKELNKI